jgi:large subunit ribosomal protein L21
MKQFVEKQHRVAEGQIVRLEKLNVETGATIDFNEVLMVAAGDTFKVGAPFVEGGKVVAEVVAHGRGEKVLIKMTLKFQEDHQ